VDGTASYVLIAAGLLAVLGFAIQAFTFKKPEVADADPEVHPETSEAD
jgi:hypothetical protein